MTSDGAPKGIGRGAPGVERPSVQGENHPAAVLDWDQVRGIRQEYAAGGTTQRKLSAKYGVSSVTIHHILHNIIWKDPGYAYTPPPRRKPKES